MEDWQEIVRRHSGVVWATTYKLLGDHEDAADCFQETFMAALEISRREKINNWNGFLRRLCIHKAIDILRRRFRHSSRQEGISDMQIIASSHPGPIQQVVARELMNQLRKALTKLPARQGEVFCMRCLEQMSYRSIARQLRMKNTAVRVLVHRTRKELKKLLDHSQAGKAVEVRS